MSDTKPKIILRGDLVFPMRMSTDELLKRVHETGGWPAGYRYLGFEHTDERHAGFSTSSQNTGWWTVVADEDDYHLSRLSAEGLARITDAVRKQLITSISYVGVDTDRLSVHGWRTIIATAKKENRNG